MICLGWIASSLAPSVMVLEIGRVELPPSLLFTDTYKKGL